MPSATVVMPRLVPERDHRLDDGARLLAALDVGDEGLVDLDLVEGERPQAARASSGRCRNRPSRCARRAGAAGAGWRACCGSRCRMDSAISSSRRCGDNPDWASACSTLSVRLRCRNCRDDTLMATLIGAGQRAAWAQACRRAQPPISAIRPMSSAMARNSPGGIGPRSGWCQRSSASNPVACSDSRQTMGW